MPLKLSVDVLENLSTIAPEEWDALVDENNPFCTHAFLHTLERSNSVGRMSGWLPCHIVIRDGEQLLAAMPLYLKNNSYGEYIFDWSWADASERSGIPYFPKLVSAVPFTPASGNRLLIHPSVDREEFSSTLIQVAHQIADETGAHSIHWLCVSEPEPPSTGIERRETLQFHWNNPGSTSFDDWLQNFKSKDRKKMRAERRKAQQNVDRIECLSGAELTDEHISIIWECYQDTISRKWGQPYLTREFFEDLNGSLSDITRVFLAHKSGSIVASSLCFERGQHLYGRYWGTVLEADSLHFEMCYHQPIEYCIQKGYSKFEAGAQGEHKLKRGLLPTAIHSWHWLEHPGLHDSVSTFLEDERSAVQSTINYHLQHSPLKP